MINISGKPFIPSGNTFRSVPGARGVRGRAVLRDGCGRRMCREGNLILPGPPICDPAAIVDLANGKGICYNASVRLKNRRTGFAKQKICGKGYRK